jgi:hypothetical protein
VWLWCALSFSLNLLCVSNPTLTHFIFLYVAVVCPSQVTDLLINTVNQAAKKQTDEYEVRIYLSIYIYSYYMYCVSSSLLA